MDDYLFTVSDPLGRLVRLSHRQYTRHILDEHPDLDDVSEIERTVSRPDAIAEDAIDPERLVYYRAYRRQPQQWMIKVVVERSEVVTAYRVKRVKPGEVIVWRR